MSRTAWQVVTNAETGGRWSALRDPTGRQWLWHRPGPAREEAFPGCPFIDVGGLEECFPTIGGTPDHGDVWSRPWKAEGPSLTVESADCELRRTVTAGPDGVVADYVLRGEPGTRFVWAGHASLELAVDARFLAPHGLPTRAWPDQARPWVPGRWPRPLGEVPYDELGPDDGTAMFVGLPGLTEIAATDGAGTLRMRLEAEGQPVGVGLWRNLNGFPADGSPTYRSVCLEPMLGHHFDLRQAGEEDAAVLPASGETRWRLLVDDGPDETYDVCGAQDG